MTTSIIHLDLTNRTENALRDAGLDSIERLLAETQQSLRRIPNLGRLGVDNVNDAVFSYFFTNRDVWAKTKRRSASKASDPEFVLEAMSSVFACNLFLLKFIKISKEIGRMPDTQASSRLKSVASFEAEIMATKLQEQIKRQMLALGSPI